MSAAQNLLEAANSLAAAADHLSDFAGGRSVGYRRWSEDEIALLPDYYPIVPTDVLAILLERKRNAVHAKANGLGIKKSEEFLNSPLSGRTGFDDRGRAGRFCKGSTPANKGVKGWQAGGRSRETQFKPGSLNGSAAKRYKPVGTERISREGYLERKFKDDGPPQSRWRAVHLLLWEEHNGPLPKGHAIAFRNGDKSDIRLENLELVSRAEMMRRNTLHRYPEEITSAIRAKGVLTRRINKLEKKR